jgi:hypothetical protein
VTPDNPASALAGGDGVDSNDNAFSGTFPYIAGPNTQAVNKGGGTGAGGTDTPTGNANPVTPKPAVAAPAAAANGYPVGGVETGEGGLGHTLIPALTGAAALLFIGAGTGSLVKGRRMRRGIPFSPTA